MLKEFLDVVQSTLDYEKVRGVRESHWWRGQSDRSWRLTPKAYRPEWCGASAHEIFTQWCRQAVAYERLPESLLERLAIAQHHGLATPLLDWTLNPLVALYFAVEQYPQKDGVVYSIKPELINYEPPMVGGHVPEDSLGGKTDVNIVGYRPPSISRRIIQQRGVFTYHPTASTKGTSIFETRASFVIGHEKKREVREYLASVGIDRASLFPDLDGLSQHVNWKLSQSR